MKANEKQAIEELAQLLDGNLPADAAHASVRQLASLATAVKERVEVPTPTPEFKDTLRDELVKGLGSGSPPPQHEPSLLERLRDAAWDKAAGLGESTKMLVATATASTMVATAGIGAVSQQALPGELLYPAKQITEDVRMGLASGLQETGRLHLQFAAERLEELILGLEGYDADTVIDLLADMDLETLTGIEELLAVYEQTGNELILVVLERFADQQREALSAIFEELPPEASPFVDRSLEILRRIQVKLQAMAYGCDNCGSDGAGLAPETDLSSFGINAPGEGPALDEACDCLGLLPSTLAREAAAGLESALSGGEQAEQDEGSGDSELGDGVTATVPNLPAPLNDAARTIERTITEITGGGGSTVTETVDETVTGTTNTVEDTTSETTDTVQDTTNDTTDTVEGTASETTDTVDDLLDP